MTEDRSVMDAMTVGVRRLAVEVDGEKEEHFIAFVGRDMVGMVTARVAKTYDRRTMKPTTVDFKRLYVVGVWRRHGIGRTLINAVETWAKAHGCTRMQGTCRKNNVAALALYRSLRFDQRELSHVNYAITRQWR